MERRNFLKLMSAVAGTTLTGCNTEENIQTLIPYLVPPEEGVIPGVPQYVASTCTECPAACGLQVKIMNQHPIKLEGNQAHPDSRGALCVRGQASLSRLYHPTRLRHPHLRQPDGKLKVVSWNEALTRFRQALEKSNESGRENILLNGGNTSEPLQEIVKDFCNKYAVKDFQYELLGYSNLLEANERIYGVRSIPFYEIQNADFLLTVGADLLDTFINPVEFGKKYVEAKKQGLIWFHAEPHLTLSGQKADTRLVLRPGKEVNLLHWLFEQILKIQKGFKLSEVSSTQIAESTGIPDGQITELLHRLVKAQRPLLLAGGTPIANPRNGLQVATLSAALQAILGMHTVRKHPTLDFSKSYQRGFLRSTSELIQLEENKNDRSIGVLIQSRIFQAALVSNIRKLSAKAFFRVIMTDVPTDQDFEADLLLPLHHSLEDWGERTPRKGLKTLIQPAIKPLYETLSEGDVYLKLLDQPTTFQQYLFRQWSKNAENWLKLGVQLTSAENGLLNVKKMKPNLESDFFKLSTIAPVSGSGLSLYLGPSVRTYDGRSHSLPLLAEVPHPISTVTYGEYVMVSPVDAKKNNWVNGTEIQINCASGVLTLPVKVQVGLPSGILQASLIHAPIFSLIQKTPENLDYPLVFFDVTLQPTGKKVIFPIMSAFEGEAAERGLIKMKVQSRMREVQEAALKEHSFFPEHAHSGIRWTMTIDLGACTGCSACVAACSIENNVPLTGKSAHLRGREMSWIRIEPKTVGSSQNVEKIQFLPMMCQQCGYAPCETVCPVYATYHNPEALNVQVYNRCVGTRYCSNNCPYKVRRFNWEKNQPPPSLQMMINPEVYSRPAGVMEKCTFCIQRIRAGKDKAKDENRAIRDGDVIPACAQTCPTEAIQFGNILDQNSLVYSISKTNRAFRVLEELGTVPNVIYLRSDDEKEGR